MRDASSSVSRDKQMRPLSAITLLHRRNVDDTWQSNSQRCRRQTLV